MFRDNRIAINRSDCLNTTFSNSEDEILHNDGFKALNPTLSAINMLLLGLRGNIRAITETGKSGGLIDLSIFRSEASSHDCAKPATSLVRWQLVRSPSDSRN